MIKVINQRNTVLILISLMLIFIIASCTKKAPEKIKIGVILPLTGVAAPYGESGKNGVDLAFKHFLKAYPEYANQTTLIFEDDKADPKTGISAFTKLTDVNHVSAIIGPMVSGVTLSIVDKINEKGILVVTPTSTSPKLRGISKFLYRTCVSDDVEGSQMAGTILKEFGINKIGVLFISNEYGLGLKQVFEKTYKGMGGEILLEEPYSPDTSDFRTIIQKIKKSNVNAIYVVGQKEQKVLVKQIKEANITIKIFATTMIEDPEIAQTGAANGVIYTYRALAEPNVTTEVRSFFNDYKVQFGKEPDYYAAANYDAATVVFQSVTKANQTKRQPIEVIKEVKFSDGATGPLTFDENNDVMQPFILKTVKDNKFVIYKKEEK